jgi:hypothetical protein
MSREVTDEMIGRLSLWAQEYIRSLRAQVGALEEEAGRLRADLAAGVAGLPESDTAVELSEGGERPLPPGSHIRFAGFYTVHYGANEITGGVRVLIVETDGDLDIRPTFDPRCIVIAGRS